MRKIECVMLYILYSSSFKLLFKQKFRRIKCMFVFVYIIIRVPLISDHEESNFKIELSNLL